MGFPSPNSMVYGTGVSPHCCPAPVLRSLALLAMAPGASSTTVRVNPQRQISRSGKSGVTRSRNNQQNKQRGNDDRRDEPALSHVTFRIAEDTHICRRRRDLAFWGIGHSPYIGTIA